MVWALVAFGIGLAVGLDDRPRWLVLSLAPPVLFLANDTMFGETDLISVFAVLTAPAVLGGLIGLGLRRVASGHQI
jgi:hypothetical protein